MYHSANVSTFLIAALEVGSTLDLDGMEHLALKVLYVSSLHPHCLWNALDLWNVHSLFFPVSIFVSPTIFCDSSDGEMMV